MPSAFTVSGTLSLSSAFAADGRFGEISPELAADAVASEGGPNTTRPPFDAMVGVMVTRTSVPFSTATSPPSSILRGSRPVYAG